MTRTLPFGVDVTLAPASYFLGAAIYLHEAKVTLCRAVGDSRVGPPGLEIWTSSKDGKGRDGPVPLSSLVSLG